MPTGENASTKNAVVQCQNDFLKNSCRLGFSRAQIGVQVKIIEETQVRIVGTVMKVGARAAIIFIDLYWLATQTKKSITLGNCLALNCGSADFARLALAPVDK